MAVRSTAGATSVARVNHPRRRPETSQFPITTRLAPSFSSQAPARSVSSPRSTTSSPSTTAPQPRLFFIRDASSSRRLAGNPSMRVTVFPPRPFFSRRKTIFPFSAALSSGASRVSASFSRSSEPAGASAAKGLFFSGALSAFFVFASGFDRLPMPWMYHAPPVLRSSVLLLCIAACGSPDPRAAEPLPEPVVLDGWPALPISLGETSMAFRTLWDLAGEEREPLRGPRNVDVDTWVRTLYTPWLEARITVLQQAADARRRLHTEPDEQRAIGAALFAWLHEDVAQRLEAVRRGLTEDERRAVQEPVPALRDRAAAAYRVCYDLALAGAHLDAWRDECAHRRDALVD